MYKLIVVDDEKIIRETISGFIEEENLGFDVVGCFRDGSEVIDYLQSNDADVVITDIRMTNVSGLELSKYIYENKPNTVVVIISGYREFEYAKKAMEYNVENYILKPTDFEEMERVLHEIKNKLDKKANEQQFKLQYQDLLPTLRQEFFTDLVMGAIKSKDEIVRKLRLLNLHSDINPNKTASCIVKITVQNYDEFIEQKWVYGKDQFNVALDNFFHQNNYNVEFYNVLSRGNDIKMLCISKEYTDIKMMEGTVRQYLDQFVEHGKKIFNIDIDAEIEQGFHNLNEIIEVGTTFSAEQISDKYKLLFSHIRSGHQDEVCSLLDSIINGLANYPIQYIHGSLIDMFATLYNKLEEAGFDFLKIEEKRFDYHNIIQVRKLDEIRHWCQSTLNEVVRHVMESGEESGMLIVNKVKKYINENIIRDISLQEVADLVYLSPTYFSRFFKQHTGETFSDFLIKERMKRAIELLKKQYKIERICNETGYRSSQYFTRAFKQYTGFTPKEYYRQMVDAGGMSDER